MEQIKNEVPVPHSDTPMSAVVVNTSGYMTSADDYRQAAIMPLKNNGSMPLADVVTQIRELQAQRKFCIREILRSERSAEAFMASTLGYHAGMEEAERKAIWKRVSAYRKNVEGGRATCSDHRTVAADRVGQRQGENQSASADAMILMSYESRRVWIAHRANIERQMEKMAMLTPAWPFVQTVRGFGALGLSVVIGETGDLAGYLTKERVWKRLGLAVFGGFRQGDPKKPGRTAEDWTEEGYSPPRRAEIWNRGDALLRAQWRGEKDGVPAHPIGPYGVVYAKRKAHTEGREGWSLGRRENDARRIMTKSLIEDLWRAWNGKKVHPTIEDRIAERKQEGL